MRLSFFVFLSDFCCLHFFSTPCTTPLIPSSSSSLLPPPPHPPSPHPKLRKEFVLHSLVVWEKETGHGKYAMTRAWSKDTRTVLQWASTVLAIVLSAWDCVWTFLLRREDESKRWNHANITCLEWFSYATLVWKWGQKQEGLENCVTVGQQN